MPDQFDFRDVWKASSPKDWEVLQHIMSGVEYDVTAQSPYEGRHRVDSGSVAVQPYMAYIVLVTLLGFRHWGNGEKVAWIVPVRFRGERLFVSHEKFGFRIRAPSISPETATAAAELERRLSRAARVADRLLEPAMRDQIVGGHVTLRNQYHLFRDRYDFLREQASLAFAAKPPDRVVRRGDDGEPRVIMSNPFRPIRQGFFLALSMLDAWFSYLEHITVLLLPFCHYDPSQDNLVKFLSADWTTKFNRIFKPDVNPAMMGQYNELREVKERFRNTYAHGGYEKGGASLLVHWPGTGAIPVTLSRAPDSVHFSFFTMTETGFDNICALLDKADELMRTGNYGRAFKFLEGGLDVAFDQVSRGEYECAVQSDEAMEDLLERESYYQDQVSNMDW